MGAMVSLDAVYTISEDVVAREIQGEFIIIPIASGVGDLEDAIFTLNETAKAIWDKLNGKRSLKDVARDLNLEFGGFLEDIEKDVIGLVEELLKRKMLVEASAV